MRTPQNPIGVRFFNAANRIGAGVDEKNLRQSFHHQRNLAAEHLRHNGVGILPLILYIHFHIRNETGSKRIGSQNGVHLFRRQRHKEFQDLFQNVILGEAVNKKQAGVPSANCDRPGNDVEIFLDTQPLFQMIEPRLILLFSMSAPFL